MVYTNPDMDNYPDSKVYGANMGPTWGRQDDFFICSPKNHWSNKRDADYLRHHRAHYDVTVITTV